MHFRGKLSRYGIVPFPHECDLAEDFLREPPRYERGPPSTGVEPLPEGCEAELHMTRFGHFQRLGEVGTGLADEWIRRVDGDPTQQPHVRVGGFLAQRVVGLAAMQIRVLVLQRVRLLRGECGLHRELNALVQEEYP